MARIAQSKMPGSVFELIPIIKPPNCTYLVHTSLWYRAGCINKLRLNSNIIRGINRGYRFTIFGEKYLVYMGDGIVSYGESFI